MRSTASSRRDSHAGTAGCCWQTGERERSTRGAHSEYGVSCLLSLSAAALCRCRPLAGRSGVRCRAQADHSPQKFIGPDHWPQARQTKWGGRENDDDRRRAGDGTGAAAAAGEEVKKNENRLTQASWKQNEDDNEGKRRRTSKLTD